MPELKQQEAEPQNSEQEDQLVIDLLETVIPQIGDVEPHILEDVKGTLHWRVDSLYKQVDQIVQHAKMMQVGLDIIREEFPIIQDINIDEFKSEDGCASYPSYCPSELSQYDALIPQNKENGEDEIYELNFSDTDYPDRDIKKGFQIRHHLNPNDYDFLDKVRPEKWESIEITDPMFKILIAICLYQNISDFTEKNYNNEYTCERLNRCLQFLQEQTSEIDT